MLFLFILLSIAQAAPDKLAFRLAEPDEVVKAENPKGILRVLKELSENTYVRDFMSLMDIMGAAAAQSTSRPPPPAVPLPMARGVRTQSNSRRVPIPMNDAPRSAFESSLSMDDAVQSESKSVSKEEWARTLFGERGVLTGVFQMMDQQRKAQNVQSDSTPTFHGRKVDLKEVFDALLMGSSKKSELGDPGQQELPEFLGICNRLSCGDIYKAIDKFRKSEFFSNFQTALGLIQDPNGWETLGKLMSNPELISQFTAGSGMEQLFGSALGEAKKESSKSQTKNSKLLPEDGDFGIDFSEDGKTEKKETPEIDFSTDMKPETSDYYEEVSKGTNISPDYDDTEEKSVDAVPPPPPSSPQPKNGSVSGIAMPELSLSIDEAVEGEEVAVDAAPPAPLTKAIGSSGRRAELVRTTAKSTTTTRVTPTTTVRTSATTRWVPPTTTTPKPTSKNYRKDSDYYAMYYDDQSH